MISPSIGRGLLGISRASLSTARVVGGSWGHSFKTMRDLHNRSISMLSAMPTNTNDDDDLRKWKYQQFQPQRSFHISTRTEIAPFLPEVVIATGIIGGWVVYRTSQGKPLTPDDALECQDAYKKQQEVLRRRQPKWLQDREAKQ